MEANATPMLSEELIIRSELSEKNLSSRFFISQKKGTKILIKNHVEEHIMKYGRFPRITPDTQKEYEKSVERAGTVDKSYVPQICGFLGRACRQMNAECGADTMLCQSCTLAEYSAKNNLNNKEQSK